MRARTGNVTEGAMGRGGGGKGGSTGALTHAEAKYEQGHRVHGKGALVGRCRGSREGARHADDEGALPTTWQSQWLAHPSPTPSATPYSLEVDDTSKMEPMNMMAEVRKEPRRLPITSARAPMISMPPMTPATTCGTRTRTPLPTRGPSPPRSTCGWRGAVPDISVYVTDSISREGHVDLWSQHLQRGGQRMGGVRGLMGWRALAWHRPSTPRLAAHALRQPPQAPSAGNLLGIRRFEQSWGRKWGRGRTGIVGVERGGTGKWQPPEAWVVATAR